MICRICGSENAKRYKGLMDTRTFADDRSYPVYTCPECGCFFTGGTARGKANQLFPRSKRLYGTLRLYFRVLFRYPCTWESALVKIGRSLKRIGTGNG